MDKSERYKERQFSHIFLGYKVHEQSRHLNVRYFQPFMSIALSHPRMFCVHTRPRAAHNTTISSYHLFQRVCDITFIIYCQVTLSLSVGCVTCSGFLLIKLLMNSMLNETHYLELDYFTFVFSSTRIAYLSVITIASMKPFVIANIPH